MRMSSAAGAANHGASSLNRSKCSRPTPLVSKLYSLYYKLDTLLDSYTLLPQRGSVYSEEGSRHRFKVSRFDHAAHKVFFEYQSTNNARAQPSRP